MATMKFSARRLIIASGFAVAAAAAPAIAVVVTPAPAATPLAQCPAGEEPDLYTSACVPHLVPNAGEPYQAGGGGGIPCTGHNSGQCIGLAEEAASEGPAAVPRSTIDSSPTVTGSEGSIG